MGDFLNASRSLTFLKLGGSLITDKTHPRTPRLDVLGRLADEIASALKGQPSLDLFLGHGAGSFGHVSAKQHGTRQGVKTPEQWNGFAEVWWDVATLNHLVLEALRSAGLPAISFPPSASVTAEDGKITRWDLEPLRAALRAGLLPVIHGDVIFDVQRGGTILSTEDLLLHLARLMQPQRLLLAGIEPGVWADFQTRSRIIPEITMTNISEIAPELGESAAIDVTGGMETKVEQCLDLAQDIPQIEIVIFSGDEPGVLLEVLLGARMGTVIYRG
jgi:isopentenyl phosphate kinase